LVRACGIIVTVLVGFDARAAFRDPMRGFGRVTRSLANALLEVLPGQVVLFVPHDAPVPPPWYPLAARIVALRRPARGAFLVDPLAWQWTLRRHRVDVLHLPAWGVPPGLTVPVVATGYDATPLRFLSPPQAWPRRRLAMALLSLRRATLVHTISAHARDELAALAGVPAARCRVVHLGAGPPFAASPALDAPQHLLFVGGLDPHKNLDLLLTMLRLPRAEHLPPLVVAGPQAPVTGALAAAAAGHRVRFAPARSDHELAALYRAALALLLPSRNEGFGLPAIEAMACGCPVIAADAGALPEVCAGAAVLLSPDRPEAWLEVVTGLQREGGQRHHLIAAGLARARQLTWGATANGLVETYRAAIRAASART
jgi:glycosyltransferase involved in cell wall biosynthesis